MHVYAISNPNHLNNSHSRRPQPRALQSSTLPSKHISWLGTSRSQHLQTQGLLAYPIAFRLDRQLHYLTSDCPCSSIASDAAPPIRVISLTESLAVEESALSHSQKPAQPNCHMSTKSRFQTTRLTSTILHA